MLVLHPFVLAVFPVLALYQSNISELRLGVVVLPILIGLLVTLAIFATARLTLGDTKKAGLLTSGIVFAFFSYGHIVAPGSELRLANVKIATASIFLFLGLAVVLSVGYLLYRSRRDFTDLTRVLNWAAVCLLILPAARIGIHESARQQLPQPVNAVLRSAGMGATRQDDQALPDIYYVVLDRYAPASTLKGVYNFDNSRFLSFLEKRGFYVADESRGNYRSTYLSLASSLNMDHLGERLKALPPDSTDRTLIYEMLQDYEVWRILKAKGYKFVHLGSGWEPTAKNKYADLSLAYQGDLGGLDSFPVQLLQTTAIYPTIEEKLRVGESTVRGRTLYQFKKLKALPDMEGPKYVFAHMLVPHDPYVFGPEGQPISVAQAKSRSEKRKYLDQLIFTNREMERIVDRLLESENPPIIVLQSDEGPHSFERPRDKNLYWKNLTATSLRTHMRILNALYVPARTKRVLYKSVTPVNTFRIIFNGCFGAKYPLLPDTSYAASDKAHPYRFRDVTAKVAYQHGAEETRNAGAGRP